MKTRTELLYLLGWVVFALLFLSPVLLRVSESLTEGWGATPSVHAQLVTNVVISLCIFLLPALFLPSGREALRAVIRPLPSRYRRAGYLLRILALVAVTILSSNLLYDGIVKLSKFLGSPVQDQVEEVVVGMIRQGSVSFGALFLALALVPALVEEIFFRGLLQPLLMRSYPGQRWKVFLFTALIFSLLHFSPAGFLSRLVLGLMLSYLAYDSRGLRIPILMHLINNTLAILSLYTS